MSTTITTYEVAFLGNGNNPGGDPRATIFLLGGSDVAGSIDFYDPDVDLPEDTNSGEWIRMNLPSTMLLSVVDVLRNERPIVLHWTGSSGFLYTSFERIGEAE